MFRHILVPLDSSTRAEQVLPVAARLACRAGGTVTLLTIVDIAYEAVLNRMAAPFLPPNTIERDLTAARNYLDQVAQRSDLAGAALEKQVELGYPAAMILSRAQEQPIDLIVMSSHGYTGVKRWLLGSVAEKIARAAPVPVLILRDEGPLRAQARFDGTGAVRALVPLDTSARALDTIPPAAELVAALSSPGHGQLHLTHMMVMPEAAHETEREGLLLEAKRKLDAIGQSIRDGLMANVGPDLPVAVSWAVSLERDIAEGIVRVAEHGERRAGAGRVERCDLIAMTTHGSTGIQRWAVGSITERVLHATSLPLLIVRPADIIENERRQREFRAEGSAAPVSGQQ